MVRNYLKNQRDRRLVFYNCDIDDIFSIFRRTGEARNTCLTTMLFAPLRLKFVTGEDGGSVPFLDMRVFTDRYSFGKTCFCQKLGSTFTYIPYSSAHLLHIKRAFCKAELTP